jgi:hypothetical protein
MIAGYLKGLQMAEKKSKDITTKRMHSVAPKK